MKYRTCNQECMILLKAGFHINRNMWFVIGGTMSETLKRFILLGVCVAFMVAVGSITIFMR